MYDVFELATVIIDIYRIVHDHSLCRLHRLLLWRCISWHFPAGILALAARNTETVTQTPLPSLT